MIALEDTGLQLALDDVLEIEIDRQLDRRAGSRRLLDARLQPVVARIPLDQNPAFVAANLRVVRRFDPAQPRVLVADKSQHVRAQVEVGVIPARLADEDDPW
jgi:hypothetical protein